MGNFFLSSCPGKKVRLGAPPVKGGRSGICRDLRMDLQRAKDEGVGLVVCCLDDQELGFLGAPWEEYSRTAQSLELGVIRIPMVEGFAPSSPAALDAHLSRIIRQHTLRGESVLAHCRGGIGRAGLVACCWILKCGLVGEIAGRGVSSGEEEDWLLGNGQAMAVVERVIDVIRKRRSVKAIETPQQVHFLLDYVTYLQTQAKTVRASDI
ncbi:phosphatases II [Meredithblackwellia eburnea MCA 4105]